jgi:hypothetical protein
MLPLALLFLLIATLSILVALSEREHRRRLEALLHTEDSSVDALARAFATSRLAHEITVLERASGYPDDSINDAVWRGACARLRARIDGRIDPHDVHSRARTCQDLREMS